MRYLPHTPEDVAEMLAAVGAGSLEELAAAIPPECRRRTEMKLPGPLTEWELDAHIDRLAGRMATAPEAKVFVGAGSYDHHIPAAVGFLASRSEFVTSYTPYQPEVSQGTLQAIFEYQTLTARLLGLEVANASMYDGASALAEALLMAVRITRRPKVAVARAVHPLYRRVVETYLAPAGIEVHELPFGPSGTTAASALGNAAELAAVAVQSPNFFGCIEELQAMADAAHAGGALCVAAFSEPLAFGLFQSPGRQGADIACGEGQSLGIPRSFGGPGLGMFATRQQHVRHMPGGKFTDHVFTAMKERDILRVEGPFGSFFLREDSDKPIVLLASGTGFAPIKAIIEHLRAKAIARPAVLYWGARTRPDLYLHDWAEQAAASMPTLRYVPVLSEARPGDAWQGRTGFVHQAVLEDFSDLSGYQVYACGAPIMVDSAREAFTQTRGLPEDEFFADAFSYAADSEAVPVV